MESPQAVASLPRIDFGTASAEPPANITTMAAGLFFRHGCLLVKNALPVAYVKELARSYAESYAEYFEDRDYPDALNVGNRRTMITVALRGPFNSPQLYANHLVLPVLRILLGTNLILGGFGSVVSLPGAQDQHRHVDHPNIYEFPAPDGSGLTVPQSMMPYAVTVIVPLVPLNATNGTTRLWPGSHTVARGRMFSERPVDPPVDPGDALLMDYRLAHCGTANRSDAVRPILYVIYNRAWFRDAANYSRQAPLSISDQEYAAIPSEFRSLVDWARPGTRSRRAPQQDTGSTRDNSVVGSERGTPCFCGSGLNHGDCHGKVGA